MDADANVNANANADAGGCTIALPDVCSGELKYRLLQELHQWIWAFCSNIDQCEGQLHFIWGINIQFSAFTIRMHFLEF